MWRIRCLVVGLIVLAALAGCAIDVANSGLPRCDRNGDEEQRVACVR